MTKRKTLVESSEESAWPVVRAAMLAVVLAWPQAGHADPVKPPPVPPGISVPASQKAFLAGHAIGTQNYSCLPSGGGFAWTLFGPQATLFDKHERQLMTHFLSPNPDESGTPRATWQHSDDTSAVWAISIGSSTDPAFVRPGAIPWLLLQVMGAEEGPAGRQRTLTPSTYIHRLNTSGGIAPATGCGSLADVGKRVFVPYEADYFFYQARKRHAHDNDND
jgi:hypothetical protein